MNKIITLILLFFLSEIAYGQYTVSGKVVDLSNKNLLFGSSIQVENSAVKTISNEDGEFEVKLSTLPATIIISHVGYKKVRIPVNSSDYLKVNLSQEPIRLPEVRVGNPAVAILNAVVEKSRLLENQKKYFNAFYRRISSNNGSINRIQEIFMNVSWSVDGVKEWQPTNIRYAKVNPLYSRNGYFLTFLYSAIFHKYERFSINSVEIGKGYELKIKNYINIGTPDEIAVISFESTDQQKDGYIYVKTKKGQLLKIVENQKIKLQHGFKITTNFEANFRENSKGETTFDNIFVVETTGKRFDLKKATEKIWLYFQDEIPSFEKGTIYPAFLKNDDKIILSIPYNAKFWQDKIPFPATENTKKIIEKMEKSDKFTSNFN
ncbi:MAG TPA: hypothetical protein DCM71_12220 [Runella sp.]|nr:hypothetical protein [Runella sp.]